MNANPYTPQNPRPVPFDLGNLAAVKVGDEVTTLDENGKPASRILIVHTVEDWRVLVRRPDKTVSIGVWLTKNGGGCPYAMHDQNVMRFYYSVNPEHIAQAKRNAKAAHAAEEARKAAFEAQMVIARPIGLELGDGEQYDNGEPFHCEGSALISGFRPSTGWGLTPAKGVGSD